MTRKTLIATAATTGLLATGGAFAVTSATAAGRAVDGDAELRGPTRLHLEAETRGASKVTFIYAGKRYAGRHTDTDREDGTKDWDRTVRALKSDRAAGKVAVFKVRACDASGACTTKTFRERLEWDD
jgi:hypothetical protein